MKHEVTLLKLYTRTIRIYNNNLYCMIKTPKLSKFHFLLLHFAYTLLTGTSAIHELPMVVLHDSVTKIESHFMVEPKHCTDNK